MYSIACLVTLTLKEVIKCFLLEFCFNIGIKKSKCWNIKFMHYSAGLNRAMEESTTKFFYLFYADVSRTSSLSSVCH